MLPRRLVLPKRPQETQPPSAILMSETLLPCRQFALLPDSSFRGVASLDIRRPLPRRGHMASMRSSGAASAGLVKPALHMTDLLSTYNTLLLAAANYSICLIDNKLHLC